MTSVDTLSTVQQATAAAPPPRPTRQDTGAADEAPPPPPVSPALTVPTDQETNVIYTALASASVPTVRGTSVNTSA